MISPSRLTGNEPLSILPLNSLPEENVGRAHYKLCDRLKLEKKQRRMCRRDPGVAETLREAVTMSALECQYQFRFERWNCTLEGRHRANILKRGMPVSSIYDPWFMRGQPATTLLLYTCKLFWLKVAKMVLLFKYLVLVDKGCVLGPHRLLPGSSWASFTMVCCDQARVGSEVPVGECDEQLWLYSLPSPQGLAGLTAVSTLLPSIKMSKCHHSLTLWPLKCSPQHLFFL